uniref:trypsin n=1 Tax=Cyprinus carpio TaxID=7962 RepID=A0A8C2GS13_CYPCA
GSVHCLYTGTIITLYNSLSARVNVGIVNGKEAEPHSRPYMVSVQSKEHHICGGFLISDRFVMTAAHCRKNSSSVLTVVLGAHDLKKSENSVRFTVESYHQNPDYTIRSFHNDILLLKVTNCTYFSNIEAGSVCSIAGWGSLAAKGKGSNHLMETNVKVMNNMECERKWGKEDFSTSQMMCVHGDGGSCDVFMNYDRGPLVCGDTAVGVTSFGDPDLCNSLKLPEVYIKISAYLSWIKDIIKKFN